MQKQIVWPVKNVFQKRNLKPVLKMRWYAKYLWNRSVKVLVVAFPLRKRIGCIMCIMFTLRLCLAELFPQKKFFFINCLACPLKPSSNYPLVTVSRNLSMTPTQSNSLANCYRWPIKPLLWWPQRAWCSLLVSIGKAFPLYYGIFSNPLGTHSLRVISGRNTVAAPHNLIWFKCTKPINLGTNVVKTE